MWLLKTVADKTCLLDDSLPVLKCCPSHSHTVVFNVLLIGFSFVSAELWPEIFLSFLTFVRCKPVYLNASVPLCTLLLTTFLILWNRSSVCEFRYNWSRFFNGPDDVPVMQATMSKHRRKLESNLKNRCTWDHQTWRRNVSRWVLETRSFCDQNVKVTKALRAWVFALLWVLASCSFFIHQPTPYIISDASTCITLCVCNTVNSGSNNKILTIQVAMQMHETVCKGDIQLFVCLWICWPILWAPARLV